VILTLDLLPQTRSFGTIALPSGGLLANTTVTLSSATFNRSVSGAGYTSGFFVPVGSYSAYGTVSVGSVPYVTLIPVTVSSAGKISPGLSLTVTGYRVTGTFTEPGGLTLPANTSATFTNAAGATALVTVQNGAFSAVLPGAQTYTVSAAVIARVQGASGPYYESWTSRPGTTCSVAAAPASCTVSMVGTAQLVWLNGTLSATGVPGLIAGSIRLYGPATAPTVSVLSATNGTFSARVLPGTYSIYGSGGGGSEPLASFATVSASLTSPNPVSMRLVPTWTDTISVAGPAGSAPLLGPINVTITNAFGVQVAYSGVAPSTPFAVALPVGSYTVSAVSFGSPFGLGANATATATVRVVSGNVGTTLTLDYRYTYRATESAVGTDRATVTSPGTATFAFSVRNTGNAPISVHPVGSPASWTFLFSFSNVTLAPGPVNGLLSATVEVFVPENTPVAHPGVVIDLEMANGTIVGSFSPTIAIVSYFGLGIGPTPTSATQVGVAYVLVPFYVSNTGNVGESVALTLVDASQLSSLGWTGSFRALTGTLHTPTVLVGAFSNATYFVNLTATTSIFLPPGTITVQGSVVNVSGSIQAIAVLSVPTVSIRPNTANGTAATTVTGPSVGPTPSGLPDWVVPLLSFVPAIALVVGVITYRWWRSRSWSRR